ncbi:MAG: cystathionine gamma-synthase family protein [Planctomycetota bacterium]
MTGDGTRAVWGGEQGTSWQGATQIPVVHSVTFGFPDTESWLETATGRRPGHIYSRNTNPTVELFEEKVRLLEGAEAATAFATGMAGISNTFFALLAPGDRIVSIKDTYGGTSRLFLEFLPKFGIEVELCESDDHDALEAAIARGCQLVYLETPTNPTLKVVDIARLARAGRAVGATVVVDNTFATPLNQRPLELGADLVVHSATKFLGGHSDAMGGVVCGKRDLIREIFRFREVNGASLSPSAAFLLIRGIKTLELRVTRQNENALALARFLEQHPAVAHVYHPGLESHPGHAIAARQMSGFGGILAFDLVGDFETLKRFLDKLRLAHRAASLGSVGTLIGPPAVTSHVELTKEDRAALGIPETLVRCSVGIENVADLIADVDQALEG